MNLNEFAAGARKAIFDDLANGREPSQGAFDAHLLAEARAKGSPQVGTTRYEPDAVHFEFVYSERGASATIVTVSVAPPERIVFLPVPEWVIESIWQGDVSGSFHFESDAQRLLAALSSELEAEANAKWFQPQAPKRRE